MKTGEFLPKESVPSPMVNPGIMGIRGTDWGGTWNRSRHSGSGP